MIGLTIVCIITVICFIVGFFFTQPKHGFRTTDSRFEAGLILGFMGFLISLLIWWGIELFIHHVYL